MLGLFRQNEVDQVYVYELLKKFAFGLISVFIPVYIASETGSVLLIFLYMLGYVAVFAVSSVPGAYIISRIGFKHSLVLSYLFYLPAFLALRSFSLGVEMVAGVALLVGLGKTFHWVALHAEFAVDSEEKHRERATGRLLGIPRLATAAAPVIGGFLMAAYGFPTLVGVVLAFMFFSAVPLVASRDHRDPMKYGFFDFLDSHHSMLAGLFFLRGIAITTGAFLFPLYVFYVVGGTVNVGGVTSLTSIGGMVFALFLGRIAEKEDNSRLIVVGALLSGSVFFLKAMIGTAMEAFILSTAGGLFFMLYYIPLYSRLANASEKEDVLEFYAFREVTLGIGKLAILVMALLVALNFSILEGLKAAILLAAVSEALIPLVIRRIEWGS